MMNNEEILEKLRKVLALANGLNATESEMTVAMMKAKEIALRYGIELAQIDLNEDAEKPTKPIDITKESGIKARSIYERPHHRYIYWILQDVFGVRIIRSGLKVGPRRTFSIHVVGAAEDVAICTLLFPWLEDTLLNNFKAEVKVGLLHNCAAHENGYYHGLYVGLLKANKKAEDALPQSDKDKWALVSRSKAQAVEDMIVQLFPNLSKKKRPSSYKQHDVFAMNLGFAKGKTLKLNQLGGGKPNKPKPTLAG